MKNFELKDISIKDENLVLSRLENANALKKYIKLKKAEELLKKEIDEVKEKAFEEYIETFKGAKSVSTDSFSLQAVEGRPSWEFSEEVYELEKRLKELKEKEKKEGRAKVTYGKPYLRVSFPKNSKKGGK